MAVYSKFLSLINGADRTVDLSISGSALGLSSLQLLGSTSGALTLNASATTTSYSLIWPAAQGAASTFLKNDGSGNLSWATTGAGTVTSVALADGSTSPIYAISGSPVTGSGTLTFTLSTQSANTVFAGPSSGSAAQPTFRALVSADIPSTISSNTSGTAANITATSNSTLTTLSALTTASSLAISGSQVSGGTFGAVNGSALTNLSAAALSGVLPVGVTGGSGLSIATSQLTGSVSLTTQVSGILPIANGGTNASTAATAFANLSPLTTAGDLIFENSTPAPARLAVGTTGQVLTVVSGLPAWATPASGSVTSVALADGSTTPIYNISGSPVTSSGTLDFTLKTQSANTVFAGPSTGSAAQPTFRALVSADIPNLSATYVTQSEVGAASGVASLDGTGKVPLAQLPAAVFIYQGAWNPSTNTPTLVDGTGVTGYVYWVSTAFAGPVAGLTNASMVNFEVGDLVIYNGTQWELTTPAAGVQSVNSAQGAVTLSMASANGFAGTYSGTALTVSTTITGILQGNGTAISAATTTGSGNVVLSASPTLTGTVTAANATLSGSLVAPTIEVTAVYGGAATLSANTTYAMRWGMPDNSETAGKLYLADWNTATRDYFWVEGLYSGISVSTGATITIVTKGTFTSADLSFSSSNQGRPAYLGSSGAVLGYSTFNSTVASGDANEKIGMVTGASTISVNPQMMGVS